MVSRLGASTIVSFMVPKTKALVDTGAWYALIDADDPDHAAILETLRAYRGHLVTTNFIFDETVTLLRYRLGWRPTKLFGEQVHSSALTYVVRVAPRDEATAWRIFSDYEDKSFSFTNCTSFAVMARRGITTAIAIDRDFKTYGLHCIP
jgi:predicted nucleic acid-binding protein